MAESSSEQRPDIDSCFSMEMVPVPDEHENPWPNGPAADVEKAAVSGRQVLIAPIATMPVIFAARIGGVDGQPLVKHGGHLKFRQRMGENFTVLSEYDQIIIAEASLHEDPTYDEEKARRIKHYTTGDVFMWQSTISYWSSVLFLKGAILFTINSGIFLWLPADHLAYAELTLWPAWIGVFEFLIAAYFVYLQAINVDTLNNPTARLRYLIPDWKMVTTNQQEADCSTGEIKLALESLIGSASILFGMLLFAVGEIDLSIPYEPYRSPAIDVAFFGVPYSVGSIFFCIWSACEIYHNRLFRVGGPSCCETIWWIVVLNAIGSVLFVVGSFPEMILKPTDDNVRYTLENYAFFIGCFLFIITAVLYLCLWKYHNFGMTLLRQINLGRTGYRGSTVAGQSPRRSRSTLLGADSEDKEKPFSARGVFFVVVYVAYLCATLLNLIIIIVRYNNQDRSYPFQQTGKIVREFFIMIMLFVILLINAVITKVPKVLPFSLVYHFLRWGSLLGCIWEWLEVCAFMWETPHFMPTGVPIVA